MSKDKREGDAPSCCTTKAALERQIGKKLTSRLSNKTKVAVMEFLLMQPLSEVKGYASDRTLPVFFASCARMLAEGGMQEFVNVLRACRDMVQEDSERETFR